MKISEILTKEEIAKLEGMKDYAVPVWAINNILRCHWKDLTIDQWIELEKLYEISGIADQISELTVETHESIRKLKNTIKEIHWNE